MRGLRIKAIVAGLATDIAGSILVGIAGSVVIFLMALHDGDTSHEHWMALKASTYLEFGGLLGTTLCTALGGYVAARLSSSNELGNSLAVGILSLLLGIALAVFDRGAFIPMWKAILGALVTVPAALIGGNVVTRSKQT